MFRTWDLYIWWMLIESFFFSQPVRKIGLIMFIESAQALLNIQQICRQVDFYSYSFEFCWIKPFFFLSPFNIKTLYLCEEDGWRSKEEWVARTYGMDQEKGVCNVTFRSALDNSDDSFFVPEALVFGSDDFAADIGATRTKDSTGWNRGIFSQKNHILSSHPPSYFRINLFVHIRWKYIFFYFPCIIFSSSTFEKLYFFQNIYPWVGTKETKWHKTLNSLTVFKRTQFYNVQLF